MLMKQYFEYGPWKVDVDIVATKAYYENLPVRLINNREIDLKKILDKEQITFFENFGIDLSKVEASFLQYDEDEENLDHGTYFIRTLFLGDLYSITKDQQDMYFETCDEDDTLVFSESDRERVMVSESESMLDTEVCGMAVIFSPPLLYYALKAEDEDINEKYKNWFCGETFVKAIIKK